MISNVRTVNRDLLTRRCVQCGFDGSFIGEFTRNSCDDESAECPKCGCDLLARPPRSYAEMEGLVEDSIAVSSRPRREPARRLNERREHLIHRWMAFLFIALVGMLAIAYLAAAVITI